MTNPDLPDPDLSRFEEILREAVIDAYAAGNHAALVQLGKAGDEAYWADWKPGNPNAAELARGGRLADLLAEAGATIRGVVGTLLRQLGDKLADGLEQGESVDTIAASLRDIVGSSARAEMIAHTEVARAMTISSLDTYTANGIGQFDLITSSGACPQCEDIAAANPHPVADTGDSAPIHPLCRCAVSPVV